MKQLLNIAFILCCAAGYGQKTTRFVPRLNGNGSEPTIGLTRNVTVKDINPQVFVGETRWEPALPSSVTRGLLIKWDNTLPTGNITYVKHDTLVVGSPSIQYIQIDETTYKIVRGTTLKATEPGTLRLSPIGIIQGPLPSGITLTPYTQSILPL